MNGVRKKVAGAIVLSSAVLWLSMQASAQDAPNFMQELLMERACQKLGVAYSHSVDIDKAENIAALFTLNGVFEMGPQLAEGRSAINRLFQQSQSKKTYVTRHQLSNYQFSRLSESEAEGVTYLALYHYPLGVFGQPDGDAGMPVAAAIYHDRYQLVEGKCLFSYRKVSPVFIKNDGKSQ